MRHSTQSAINQYIKTCKHTDWISDEAYKFQFANYIQQNIDWSLSDEEILQLLIYSQRINYISEFRGIQFITKSGRKKLSEFVDIPDVQLFRKARKESPEQIDWTKRSMSFTGLSAWLSSLFPDRFYPVPLMGFNFSIKHLFDTEDSIFPKKGLKYILYCQPYMDKTEQLLKEHIEETAYLQEWNKFYEAHQELNITPKDKLTKVDWVWMAQDFHLFVYRRILGYYKKKPKKIKIPEEIEPIAIEGSSVLAMHMRRERDSGFIRKIKEQAAKENRMLNCEVCGFSFLETYGKIGEGFIEAHHTNPLAQEKGEVKTTKADIALVCSNCHRMLHRGNPIYSIGDLKKKMNRK